ncbi:FAD-binding protein [Caldifermentibacillus hisashii]|uniref:FAD-binding protein n=1 Tax=Caldifermentibacillus hisashii TaxID=996558 RepID=A0ABU9JUD1_9BACI
MIFTPDNISSIKDIFLEYGNTNKQLEIRGTNSKSMVNNTSNKTSKILTSNFNNVINYNYFDFLITVGSGITIEELESITRKRGQTVLLDNFFVPMGTVGGRISLPFYTPLELDYGFKENYINKLSFIAPNGKYYEFGANTLKNVAGYSLERYFVGKLGKLGLIDTVTLRTFPLVKRKNLFIIKSTEYIDNIKEITSVRNIIFEDYYDKSVNRWYLIYGEKTLFDKHNIEYYEVSESDNISELSDLLGFKPIFLMTAYYKNKKELNAIKLYAKENRLALVFRKNLSFVYVYSRVECKSKIELPLPENKIYQDCLFQSLKTYLDPKNILI